MLGVKCFRYNVHVHTPHKREAFFYQEFTQKKDILTTRLIIIVGIFFKNSVESYFDALYCQYISANKYIQCFNIMILNTTFSIFLLSNKYHLKNIAIKSTIEYISTHM